MNKLFRSFLEKIPFRGGRFWPDSWYQTRMFKNRLGYSLNLDYPKTFNEKIQWLKLYDRNPLYTTLADKIKAKDYVAKIIGKEYIIPTLNIYKDARDINFDELPNQFVLKCNHDWASCVICSNKNELDYDKVILTLTEHLNFDFWMHGREWSYKNIEKRIFAEKYMVDESGEDLKDYKFFCFNGKVEFCKVDFNRHTYHRANYFSPSWERLPFGEADCPPNYELQLECPPNFNKMLDLAETLAKNIPFVRIDFYNIGGKIYFGEFTFYPACGFGKFVPSKADEEIGKLLQLPTKKFHYL